MWYWILILAVLTGPGVIAQESPGGAVAETPMVDSGAAETAEEVGDTEAGMIPEPTPVLKPPRNLDAADMPYDDGGTIEVKWEPPVGEPDVMYSLEMAGSDGFYQEITRTRLTEYTVLQLENFKPYRFRVSALYENGKAMSDETEPVMPRDHWFKLTEMPIFIAIFIFTVLLLFFIQAARRGVELFVRRISGLTAVEDAIGRATEMGKPVLYVPGTSSIEDVATLASLNILGEVARRTVHYDVKIICPNRDPIVYTIAREVVKETYASEGRPDAFDPDSVFYMVPDQFAYAAGVDGIMVREKPATIFLMGMFWAESLIMAETGASTGAIQIAGTDSVAQLPFFITACDYTLIGEELYAASAYLGREPMLLGTLKAQDYGKLVFLIIMVLLTLISILSGWDAASLIRVR